MDNNLIYINFLMHFYEYLNEKLKVHRCNMHHFKAIYMINLQYEIKIWKTILDKATNDKN